MRAVAPCEPVATPEDKTADAGVDLRAVEIRPGDDVPAVRPRLRRAGRGIAILQCLRRAPGAFQSLHRGAGDFRARAISTDGPPVIFEDGRQLRDFVHVRDLAAGCVLALENAGGTRRGVQPRRRQPYSVLEIAERLGKVLGQSAPATAGPRQLSRGRYPQLLRRHLQGRQACWAISPQITLEAGLGSRWRNGWRDAWTRIARKRPRRSCVATGWSHERARRAAARCADYRGAGFVGSNLAQRLLAEGRRVLVFDNLSRAGVRTTCACCRNAIPEQLEVEVADVRDARAVSRAVERADEIYHLAAQVAVTTSLAVATG